MNHSASDRGDAIRAIVPWVIVVAGLLYGVVYTASQMADLFGG